MALLGGVTFVNKNWEGGTILSENSSGVQFYNTTLF